MREVLDPVLNVEATPTNNTTSHSISIKEVEDKECPRHRAKESEEKKTAMTKEQLEQEQDADNEERKHQGEQAKEKTCKTWKKRKGPSQ